MITISGISKSYGRQAALTDVSVVIPDGAICAIVGPNGAGKSTLLKILSGILGFDRGSVDYGEGVARRGFRRGMTYMPEQRGLYSGIDIATQLAFFAKIRGMGGKEAAASIDHWLRRFDIGSWRRRRISELSKGMQQKVQLISCLVSRPTLMLMDEPFSGIDPINFRLFAEVLTEYNAESEATIALSTHNMKSVEDLCTDVILLNKGRVEISGNVGDVKRAHTQQNLLEVRVRTADAAADKTPLPPLGDRFEVMATRKEQGELVLTLADKAHDATNESLRDVLALLDGFDVSLCAKHIPSMEEIFIELGTRQ